MPFLREMADYCTLEGDINHDEASFGQFRSQLTCLTPPKCPLTFWSRSGTGQGQGQISDLDQRKLKSSERHIRYTTLKHTRCSQLTIANCFNIGHVFSGIYWSSEVFIDVAKMVMHCSVASCRNSAYRSCNASEKKENGLSFFGLPKNPRLREIWMKKCGRKDFDGVQPQSIRICSEHFLLEDFCPSYLLKKKLMPNAGKAVLRKGIIPTQKLSGQVR